MNPQLNRLAFSGQHAVITGASRGIGRAIACELFGRGAHVTLIARDKAALRDTAAQLGSAGVAIAPADVTDHFALRMAIDHGRDVLGPVDILINNAGGTESSPFLKVTSESWQRTMDLNLTSAVIATQACLPDMMTTGFGRVVNVASVAGLKGVAYASAYTAAKHALVGLTRALALETAAKGVTVNAICPGYTETPMLDHSVERIVAKTARTPESVRRALAAPNPMGRFVTMQEVASAVVWLCDPSSSAINGIALPVAGGEFG